MKDYPNLNKFLSERGLKWKGNEDLYPFTKTAKDRQEFLKHFMYEALVKEADIDKEGLIFRGAPLRSIGRLFGGASKLTRGIGNLLGLGGMRTWGRGLQNLSSRIGSKGSKILNRGYRKGIRGIADRAAKVPGSKEFIKKLKTGKLSETFSKGKEKLYNLERISFGGKPKVIKTPSSNVNSKVINKIPSTSKELQTPKTPAAPTKPKLQTLDQINKTKESIFNPFKELKGQNLSGILDWAKRNPFHATGGLMAGNLAYQHLKPRETHQSIF